MIAKNFTKVRRREKRFYSLYDTKISETGILKGSIALAALMMLPFNAIGFLYCNLTGTFWYNPFLFLESPNETGYFYIFVFVLPTIIGFALNQKKIQGYKAWDYLKMYFMPKIPVNQNGERVTIEGYELNTEIYKEI